MTQATTFTCYDPQPAGQVCPLCRGKGREVGRRDGYPLRECCGILLSWQWPSEGAYLNQYTEPGHYHGAVQEHEGQRPSALRDTQHLRAARLRLEVLRQLVPARSLCDVGCGTGAMVAQAEAYGYAAEGIDPCPEMVEFARRQGRNVAQGTWLSVDGPFDLITLCDVWEHLAHPTDCLTHLRGLLSPGGALYVEIPEWDGPQARREGLAWKHVRPTQHLFLPSDVAAHKLFARAGLEVEASWRPLRGSIGKIAYVLGRAE